MSLPSRERELKLKPQFFTVQGIASLPSRERELKHSKPDNYNGGKASLPSRERELKHDILKRMVFKEFCRSLHGSAS